MSVRNYRELVVWQKSMDLALAAYACTRRFPSDERFVLVVQIRRAATSVPANIAEGNGRLHRGDYVHHLSIARGSVKELEVHLLLSERLGYLSVAMRRTLEASCDEINRMLTGLIRALLRKP